MGCFDGAEICELVGTYIQSNLTKIMNKEGIGLYCNDGLGIFQNISRPEIETKKKAINCQSQLLSVLTFISFHIHDKK